LHLLYNRAQSLSELRRFDEAVAIYGEIVDVSRRVFGDEHPDTLGTINGYAIALDEVGDSVRAEQMFLELLTLVRRSLGETDEKVAFVIQNLAALWQSQKRWAEAEAGYREVLALLESQGPGARSRRSGTLYSLGPVLEHLGRASEAERAYLDALLEISDDDSDPSWLRHRFETGYGSFLLRTGRLVEAELWTRRGVEGLECAFDPEHPLAAKARGVLADIEARVRAAQAAEGTSADHP